MEKLIFKKKIELVKSLIKRYHVQRRLTMNTCTGATETLIVIFKRR